MPKYVSAKDSKVFNTRVFNPTESDYMSKKSVVKKVIKKLHGEHRRQQLEKLFKKLNVEETIMLAMLVEKAIEKELNSKRKETI